MNERIKQLADQARKHFPKTESSGEFWVFDEAKFAELIVKETLEVARAGVEFGDGMESAVEQYFGVKL